MRTGRKLDAWRLPCRGSPRERKTVVRQKSRPDATATARDQSTRTFDTSALQSFRHTDRRKSTPRQKSICIETDSHAPCHAPKFARFHSRRDDEKRIGVRASCRIHARKSTQSSGRCREPLPDCRHASPTRSKSRCHRLRFQCAPSGGSRMRPRNFVHDGDETSSAGAAADGATSRNPAPGRRHSSEVNRRARTIPAAAAYFQNLVELFMNTKQTKVK